MKLADALIDEGLDFRLFAGDRKVHLAHARHQIGSVPWSVIKRLTVDRMAGGGNGRVRLGCRRGRFHRLVAAQS